MAWHQGAVFSFFEVMERTYTIHRVQLETDRLSRGVKATKLYDSPFRDLGHIPCIARLNAVGREDAVAHAGDKEQGIALLQKVGDDLSCIFYHLRFDQPNFCKGSESAVSTKSARASVPPKLK